MRLLCIVDLRVNVDNIKILSAARCHGELTLRRLMSYIYMEHPFLMFLDHTTTQHSR